MDSNLQIRLLCNAVVSAIKTYVWELMNLQSLWNNVRWYQGGRIDNSRQGSVECQLAVKSFFLQAENYFSVEGKTITIHQPILIAAIPNNCKNFQPSFPPESSEFVILEEYHGVLYFKNEAAKIIWGFGQFYLVFSKMVIFLVSTKTRNDLKPPKTT